MKFYCICLWQNVVMPQKANLAGELSIHALQAESLFPAAYNEEKVKSTSLCFLCSYVNMGVFMSKHEKKRLTRSLIHLSSC